MEKQSKFMSWIKKYGAYAMAGALVLVLSGAVLVTGLTSSAQKAESGKLNGPVVSVTTEALKFEMPMANATMIKDFSSEELYLNSTLGRWEFHDGIDLVSSDLKVFAVADGEVVDVADDGLNGTTVTVRHSDSLVSVYASLDEDVEAKKGDKVKAGQLLGMADDSASNEAQDGKHLHFSMIENGKKIDPANYLEFEVK